MQASDSVPRLSLIPTSQDYSLVSGPEQALNGQKMMDRKPEAPQDPLLCTCLRSLASGSAGYF